MREPKLIDYTLLTLLSLIWASAFFNIKIATYSYGPVMIAFLRIFFGAIPVVGLCLFKKIKIEAFSKDWYWFALIGFVNLVIPFFLIAYGVQKIQSNLAAILMSTTPLSSAILAHFFTKTEKINFTKIIGVIVGFLGIIILFSDNILINNENFFYALMILVGSTFYVIGGILTLKFLKNEGNENVSTSTILWSMIFICPLCLYQEPWLNLNPSMESTIALIYLGIFPTGVAWMLRFHILTKVGMVFQTQVAYLIPIFGIIFGYLIMDEQITWKVIVSLIIIILCIFMVKKGNKGIQAE